MWRSLNVSNFAPLQCYNMYISMVLYQDTFLPPLQSQHSLHLSSVCSWVTIQILLLDWQCGCPYPASSIILWKIACIAPVWTKEQCCVALCFVDGHWLVVLITNHRFWFLHFSFGPFQMPSHNVHYKPTSSKCGFGFFLLLKM